VARSLLAPRDLEARNANLIGGDINGGVHGMCGSHAAMAARRAILR
jgi:hypothetical protein